MHIDPSWKAAQKLGHLVRLDSRRKGQQFRPMTGGVYTYIRQDGGNHGAHWARSPDGNMTVFAGCADVEMVPDWGAMSRECDDSTMF